MDELSRGGIYIYIYIYNRLIVRFPIGLDFLFITFLLQNIDVCNYDVFSVVNVYLDNFRLCCVYLSSKVCLL